MFDNWTQGQKRGALALLLLVALVAGWRLRARYLNAKGTEPQAVETAASAAEPADRGPRAKVHVDLNAADTTELQTVRGIGPTYARRIVRYRELIGGIQDPEQLMQMGGITAEKFLTIEEQVYVDTLGAAYLELRNARIHKNQSLRQAGERPGRSYGGYSARSSGGYRNQDGDSRYASADSRDAAKVEVPTADAQEGARMAAGEPALPAHSVNINTADSAALVQVPGIGPATARGIIKFRKIIGFYHSVEQVREVYTVRPENFERMKDALTVGDLSEAPFLRINEQSVEELGPHRYMGWKAAKVLVAYRDMHGPFQDLAAMQSVHGLDGLDWEKLAPYLRF